MLFVPTKPGRNFGWVKAHPKLLKFLRTGWYVGAQKPVRPGVYERQFKQGLITYSRWTGMYWCVGDTSYCRAAWQTAVSQEQKRPWRGYAKGVK